MSRFERYPEPAKPKATARRWWNFSTTEESHTWDLTDAAILVGLALVVAGIALVSKPVALIVGGVVLAGLAVLGPKR